MFSHFHARALASTPVSKSTHTPARARTRPRTPTSTAPAHAHAHARTDAHAHTEAHTASTANCRAGRAKQEGVQKEHEGEEGDLILQSCISGASLLPYKPTRVLCALLPPASAFEAWEHKQGMHVPVLAAYSSALCMRDRRESRALLRCACVLARPTAPLCVCVQVCASAFACMRTRVRVHMRARDHALTRKLLVGERA
eukprot:6171965-Pleurochrysis_carterae.AAC.2